MAKKSKKTNKELLQEIREEGMFKEARDVCAINNSSFSICVYK